MALKELRKITLFSDGASRGNPGQAGAGAVLVGDGMVIGEVAKYLGKMTNNEAEYEAVLLGLSTLKKMVGKKNLRKLSIEVKMDSELVARQLAGVYQLKEKTLFPYFVAIWNLQVKDFPKIIFTHIPREKNKEADRLANEAIDSSQRGLL